MKCIPEGEEGDLFSMTVAGTAVTREDTADRSAPVMEEERPDEVRVARCHIGESTKVFGKHG